MKAAVLAFIGVVLCALTYAEIPEVFSDCSFRLTAHAVVKSVDGEELGNSINEIIQDNGYWVWNSQFEGSQFISSIVPDHEWGIIWRRDVGRSYRHDILSHSCVNSSDLPTPFKWIESMTYGVVWFDEPVWFNDKEAILYTGAGAGEYNKHEYEFTVGFYVTKEDMNIVDMNGTVTVNHGEIELVLQTTRMSFEHNKPIDPRVFAVEGPCPVLNPPEDSHDESCYKKSGASLATVSWIAFLVALLAALLNF